MPRRLLAIFLLAVLAPLSVLTWLGYRQVRGQEREAIEGYRALLQVGVGLVKERLSEQERRVLDGLAAADLGAAVYPLPEAARPSWVAQVFVLEGAQVEFPRRRAETGYLPDDSGLPETEDPVDTAREEFMARYLACEAGLRTNDLAAARQEAETLFRDGLHRYRSSSEGAYLEFYLKRLDGLFGRLVQAGAMGAAEHEGLRLEDRRLREGEAFIPELEGLVLPELALARSRAALSSAEPYRLALLAKDRPARLVSCTASDSRTVVGCVLNLGQMWKDQMPAMTGLFPIGKLGRVEILGAGAGTGPGRGSGAGGVGGGGDDGRTIYTQELDAAGSLSIETDAGPYAGSVRVTLSRQAQAELRWQLRLYLGFLALLVGLIVLGLVLVVRAARREMELANLKFQFVSNVSHELKTPLALIRMFGEILALGYVKDQAQAKDYSLIIAKESERLTQLIDNVLEFSRIESERKSYDFYQEDLGLVVCSTAEAYRYYLRERGFELDIDCAEDLPPAVIDKDAISQALINLLNNAARYSAEDKRIVVRCFTRGQEALIEVHDQGIGIEPREQARIFEKFYRGKGPLVQRTRGAGLGLTLVKHIAEAHVAGDRKGRVEVESEPGKGSTFRIVLPLAQEPEMNG